MSSAQIPTTAFPQLGRFQILQKLGEGGMGAVYLAQDTHLSRQVAVKILPPHSVNNPDAIARFQREARALAQLSHPNIIQAYDVGSENGQHFLVMEYIEGQSLAAILEKTGPLPPARAAAYIHQAALALEHAHEKGLIHRDVKPSNLLVTRDGQVKLLDLGLSRFLQDQLGDASKTREGVGMGTPDYAPPEQFRDAHNVDHRADIYSLGCTLYHLLTGRVPFPGTSLSDKYTAHATRQPTPLEELGIEAPAGLVLVLEKMVAKSPTERFQTARDVADALLPYVSTTSASFAKFKSTASWQMGQLTMPEFPRRRRWLPWAIAGVAVVAALVLLALMLTNALRPGTPPTPQVAQDDPKDKNQPEGNTPAPKKPDPQKPEEEKKPVVERDPNIITVSKNAKDHAQFDTITEALDKVAAGQTIRVLDDAVYPEHLVINHPGNHAGVRIEAIRDAVLELTSGQILVTIEGVTGVTLSHFHLRPAKDLKLKPGQNPVSLIGVQLRCRDVCLERLTLDATQDCPCFGVEVSHTESRADESTPILILRDSVLHRCTIGMFVFAQENNQRGAQVNGIVVRNNLFTDGLFGISIVGETQRVQVVGNKFWGIRLAAVNLSSLLGQAGGILLANNTLLECTNGVRGWDEQLRGKNIQVRNNLFLGSKNYDMGVIVGRQTGDPSGPADGAAAARLWQFDYNWREGKAPDGTGPFDKGWIPLGKKEVLREHIEGIEREAKSPHFLRPDKGSELAKAKSAGDEEPSLPRYVGAVPPEGVEPWDWNRTWLAWPGTTKLLTVSKDTNDGGEYRTLNAALAKASKWDTIRVLDDAIYPETLTLNQPDQQTGITLEAIRSATLQLPAAERRAVFVQNVSHVRLLGFQFKDLGTKGSLRTFVLATGKTAGLDLNGLRFESRTGVIGVVLQDIHIEDGDAPAIVRRCNYHQEDAAHADGIVVVGHPEIGPTSNVRIEDNVVFGAVRGIWVNGKFHRLHITGNVVINCVLTGLQIEDLAPSADAVLFANNTSFGSREDFRIHTNGTSPKWSRGQVELVNNLFFEAGNADMARSTEGQGGVIGPAEDRADLIALWTWRHNGRDFSGSDPRLSLPRAAKDFQFAPADLLSIDAAQPNRVRPRKDTSLATRGAGNEDASLPVYVGALSPEGVAPWNWDWTWQARIPRDDLPKK